MSKQIVLVDAHVHVYPGVDVPGLLTAAVRNFRHAAKELGADQWQGILLLTEIATVDWFDSIANAGAGATFGPWKVQLSTSDANSLKASADGVTLTLVAGRQIVTAERLEVHALGTRAKFPDGLGTEATLQAVRASGAIAALPWGVGKWAGGRGRLVEQLLTSASPRSVFAADNGGRPWFWSEPRLRVLPQQPVLRGSDPLPLEREEYRVGEFGSWLEGSVPDDAPASVLLARLAALPPAQLHAYGPPEGAVRFFRNQLMLRLKGRTGLSARPN